MIEGRAAIVTGSGQGLGRAIAQRFAAHGASVVVADIDPDRAAETTELVRRAGGSAIAVPSDVRDDVSVDRLVQACADAFGTVDIVVNNASVVSAVTVRSMSISDWDRVLDVHLKGTWLMMRAASVPMRSQRRGSIINISSIVAKTGGIAQGHYAAAKAGVVGLSKSAAKEWGADGVRVNVIQPGLFATETARSMSSSAWQSRIDQTPLRRAGDPDELAGAALFLASDLASFVTGAVLEVTGGRDM